MRNGYELLVRAGFIGVVQSPRQGWRLTEMPPEESQGVEAARRLLDEARALWGQAEAKVVAASDALKGGVQFGRLGYGRSLAGRAAR